MPAIFLTAVLFSQSSFAYNGHDFSVVENETAVMVAGNAVMLWNTKTLKKDYIW